MMMRMRMMMMRRRRYSNIEIAYLLIAFVAVYASATSSIDVTVLIGTKEVTLTTSLVQDSYQVAKVRLISFVIALFSLH